MTDGVNVPGRASAKCDPTVLATRNKMKEGQDSENTNKLLSDNLNLIISHIDDAQ